MNTGKGRILVVDDEMINRVLLSTNLEQSGFTHNRVPSRTIRGRVV